MFRQTSHQLAWGLLAAATLLASGCSGLLHRGNGCCDSGACEVGGCGADGCNSCGKSKKFGLGLGKHKGCDSCSDGCDTCGKSKKFGFGKHKDCDSCGSCDDGCGSGCCLGGCCGLFGRRSLAIPDEYPVGAIERAHFHQMQTNAEAADFILFQKDFVLETAELTPDGKDKVLEIAARMRSAPFPVIIERTWNNSNPEVDAHRRAIVAQILTDLGNADANNRTFVSPSYGLGKTSQEAAPEYFQFIFSGNNNNNFGNNNGGGFGGGGGGFGGGGGGGGGFGGGGF